MTNVISCETIAIHTITNIILWRFVKHVYPSPTIFFFFLILSSTIVHLHLPCCLTLPVLRPWSLAQLRIPATKPCGTQHVIRMARPKVRETLPFGFTRLLKPLVKLVTVPLVPLLLLSTLLVNLPLLPPFTLTWIWVEML